MKFYSTVNEQAEALLAVLKSMYANWNDKMEVIIKHFDNCREQGYVLELHYVDNHIIFEEKSMWVAFAEHRNSDSIVVYADKGYYPGTADDIKEEVWTSSKIFKAYCYTEAAEYIYELFIQHGEQLTEEGE